MISEHAVSAMILQLQFAYPDLSRATQSPENFDNCVKVWVKALQSMSENDLIPSMDMLLATHRERNVTPSHLLECRDRIANIVSGGPDFGDVFAEIIQGINNWEYHAHQIDGGWKPKFAQTNMLAKKLGGWATISRDDTNRDVLRSNGMRIWESTKTTESDTKRLPGSVADMIPSTGAARITPGSPESSSDGKSDQCITDRPDGDTDDPDDDTLGGLISGIGA